MIDSPEMFMGITSAAVAQGILNDFKNLKNDIDRCKFTINFARKLCETVVAMETENLRSQIKALEERIGPKVEITDAT